MKATLKKGGIYILKGLGPMKFLEYTTWATLRFAQHSGRDYAATQEMVSCEALPEVITRFDEQEFVRGLHCTREDCWCVPDRSERKEP